MSLHLYTNISPLVDALKAEMKKVDNNDDLYERALTRLFRQYDFSTL